MRPTDIKMPSGTHKLVNVKMLAPHACIMIEQFKREAEAAIKAMKGY